MSAQRSGRLAATWAEHDREWRDPAQVVGLWRGASDVDPALLRWRATNGWWEALAATDATLLVTREYEHLVVAIGVVSGRPQLSYLAMPHPSGLVADRDRGVVHVASTRNPNQVIDLAPVTGAPSGHDTPAASSDRPLVPLRSRFYPGCLYLHDLALIGGQLHANAVGMNAVVWLCPDATYRPVWWPRCIETGRGPLLGRNHLQLNSIAAGPNLAASFFSASTDRVSARRPGHRNFPVDRRGVVFAGTTREPIVRGLTRPHSARLANDGRLWVDNSGYGEIGVADGERFVPVTCLPGWTRGLCFHGGVAFVGTSRVIPRFRQYAPGLDVEGSVCGLHAVDAASGRVLGSIVWPSGNQIFAIDWLPAAMSDGFPFKIGRRRSAEADRRLFYAFATSFQSKDAP